MKVTSIDVGTRNFAICVVDDLGYSDIGAHNILFWDHHDFGHVTMELLIRRLAEYLLAHPIVYDVDRVFIEAQNISASPIRCFHAAIYSHFITHKINNGLSFSLADISAGAKFKFYKGPAVKYKRATNKRVDRKNKLMAQFEKLTGHMITAPYIWYRKLSKKDDACDCMMQAFYILKNFNPK